MMRYLRIFAVLLFVASLVFAGWANQRYYGSLDTDGPTLESEEAVLNISVQDSETAIFRGLRATDRADGDLTDEILISSVSHFLQPGTVNVKYVVFDSHGNGASLTRKVCYTDYTAPVFSLEKAPVYRVGQSFDLLDYVKVTDCLDGDISDRIRVVSNMVNNYAAGTYPVVLEVSNSCGDTRQLQLWVHYGTKENTVLVMLHQYLVYLEKGSEFDPYRYVASVTDREGNVLQSSYVEIQGNLDVNTPGDYQLIYQYSDGKHTGQSAITVVVTEG